MRIKIIHFSIYRLTFKCKIFLRETNWSEEEEKMFDNEYINPFKTLKKHNSSQHND